MIYLVTAFLSAVTASACDKDCMSSCFTSSSDSDCLRLCDCEFPYSIAHFGGTVMTEDGREFYVQDIPIKEREYVSEVYDCNLKCGQLCFRFAKGLKLLECVNFCGCGMFITETTANNGPVQTAFSTHENLSLGTPESQDCKQRCETICDNEKCQSLCEADFCGEGYVSLLGILGMVGVCGVVIGGGYCLQQAKTQKFKLSQD